jgi:hypothetical protein
VKSQPVPSLDFSRQDEMSGQNKNFTYSATLENGAVLKVVVSSYEGNLQPGKTRENRINNPRKKTRKLGLNSELLKS